MANRDRPITAIFEGFSFLGHESKQEIRRDDDLPQKIVAEVAYTFTLRADLMEPLDQADLLVKRLKLAGFEVLKRPKADGTAMLETDPGGTFFEIDAKKNNCILSIWKTHSRFGSRWTDELFGRFSPALGYFVLNVGSSCEPYIR